MSDSENSVLGADDSDIEEQGQDIEKEVEQGLEQDPDEDPEQDPEQEQQDDMEYEENSQVGDEGEDELEDDNILDVKKKVETPVDEEGFNVALSSVVQAEDNFKFDISEDQDEGLDVDEDDDDDDDDDEFDLEKIDYELKQGFLRNNHPEKMQHNYDEVYHLAKVLRNKHGEIIDDLHKTTPILNKYEKAKILGTRANQINNGSKPFITLDSNVIDAYVIAQMELHEKKIPFIIRRPIPNGGSEYWHIQDLENI